MAETLGTHWARGRLISRGAGSRPKGNVHPLKLETTPLRTSPVEPGGVSR